MDAEQLLAGVADLSDLELAVLISLIAKQSCLIYGEAGFVNHLASELALIVSDIFKLSYAVLESSDLQSVDTFSDAILDEQHHFANEDDFGSETDDAAALRSKLQNVSFRGSRSYVEQNLDSRMVVNVVIAKDFDQASHDVQIQIMDIIRRRRIFSKTTVHPVPKTFLFLPIISTTSRGVQINPHLNDRIFMSHLHTTRDGFPNVEELELLDSSRSALLQDRKSHRFVITSEALDDVHRLGLQTTITPVVRRHLQDISVFLRLERGVDGGITAYSNVCFVNLAKFLAPLHGISYVTPSLIDLAAKKVFPHRLVIAGPERERSTQFGSNVDAVRQYMQMLTPELVIESVLAKVPTPI